MPKYTKEGKKKKWTKIELGILLVDSKVEKFFNDQSNNNYALIEVDKHKKDNIEIENHKEIWDLSSQKFKDWIVYIFNKRFFGIETPLHDYEVKTIISAFQYRANIGEKITLYNRVAFKDGKILYDLSNPNWEIVEISKDGWNIIKQETPIFRRFSHQHEQKITKLEKGFGDYNLIDKYIYLNDDDKLLVKNYIITNLIPKIEHTILDFWGEQNSAKTFILKLCKKIIDPSIVDVAKLKQDVEVIFQTLSHHWWVGFDNLSFITPEISDLFCTVVTGVSYTKRKLYTDDEDFTLKTKRGFGLNGINIVIYKPDLLDRCIMIKSKEVKKEERIKESKLWNNFEEDRNKIMNGVFDILCKALNIYNRIEEPTEFRMIDFAHWGEAISQATENPKGEFLKIYRNNVEKLNLRAIEGHVVGLPILKWMESKSYEKSFGKNQIPINGKWEGKATHLLKILRNVYNIMLDEDEIPARFPKSSSILMRRINQIKSNLRKVGIVIERTSETYGSNIVITNKKYKRLSLNDIMGSVD